MPPGAGDPTEQAAAARQSRLPGLVGPYGLNWLLERIADYGQDEPTWRKAAKPTKLRESREEPPQPLQMLVPEILLFDEGRGRPTTLFFTDHGGFVRARRWRAYEGEEHVQALISLSKHRQRQERQHERQHEHQLNNPGAGATMSKDEADELRSAWASSPGTSKNFDGFSERGRRNSVVSAAQRSWLGRSFPSPRTLGSSRRPTVRTPTWRLALTDGSDRRLSDQELEARFEAWYNGQKNCWSGRPAFLQMCFWRLQRSGTANSLHYHYDSLRQEKVQADRAELVRNVRNHFERFQFLDDAAARNMISAVPLLISQHLSWNMGLELVSGDFEFARDCYGRLWLADVRDLFLTPVVSQANEEDAEAANTWAGGGVVAQPVPRIYRYLSEEKLHDALPPDQDRGQYLQMMDRMHEHYKAFKTQHQVDDMLRKVHEPLDVTIPIFEGTDREALNRFFDSDASSRNKPNSGDAGRSRVKDASTARRPASTRGRFVQATTAATASPPPGIVHKAPRARVAAVASPVRPSSARPGTRQSWRAAQKPQQQQQPGSPGIDDGSSSPSPREGGIDEQPEEQRGQVVLASSTHLQQLLNWSGPGGRPDGPTLDTVATRTLSTPGEGMRSRSRAAQPLARFTEVAVPEGWSASEAPGGAAALKSVGRPSTRVAGRRPFSAAAQVCKTSQRASDGAPLLILPSHELLAHLTVRMHDSKCGA